MARPPAPARTSPRAVVRAQRREPETVTNRMQERLAEQARAEAVRHSRRSAAWWLAFFALVAAAWVVWLSPVFALERDAIVVRVETGLSTGGASVSAAAVAAALEPFVGTPLTRIDIGAATEAVREIEGVRDVAVSRAWPNGLEVTAFERVAVAAVPDLAGGFYLVDANGDPLSASAFPPSELPVVVVPVGAEHVRVLQAVLRVVGQLPPELTSLVEGIRAETEDSVEFDLRDGPTVLWGSAEQTPLKGEVLLLLIESGQTVGATAVDVSAPTLPIIVD